MTHEFWPAALWRCLACERERARLYQARRRLDPEFRLRQINKSRRYQAFLRGTKPELVEVEAREQRIDRAAAQRERRRERNRKWMREYRARIGDRGGQCVSDNRGVIQPNTGGAPVNVHVGAVV
jgi:hypothetical protein